MATLYELTSEYMELLTLAEDPDTDPQAFADTLEGLTGEIEDKADNYAKVLRMLDGDAQAIHDEERRLRARREAIENSIKRMKQMLQYMMEATGKTKIKTQLFSFSIGKNPASVVMDEYDIENIPERFLKYKDPEIDRTAIKNAIKAGDQDAMDIAHLEQTTGLRIR